MYLSDEIQKSTLLIIELKFVTNNNILIVYKNDQFQYESLYNNKKRR